MIYYTIGEAEGLPTEAFVKFTYHAGNELTLFGSSGNGTENIVTQKVNTQILINVPVKKSRDAIDMNDLANSFDKLVNYLDNNQVKSVALPLLSYDGTKTLLEQKIKPLVFQMDFLVCEPVEDIKESNIVIKPKSPLKVAELQISALVLMKLKLNLQKFSIDSLQAGAYFLNQVLGRNYFFFNWKDYMPVCDYINQVTPKIKLYQDHHKTDTVGAATLLEQELSSDVITHELKTVLPYIEYAAKFVNTVPDKKQLQCCLAILHLSNNTKVNLEEATALVESHTQYFTMDDIIIATGLLGKWYCYMDNYRKNMEV